MTQRNKQNSRPKNPKHWAKVPRSKVRSLTSDRKSLSVLTSKLCCWPIRWRHWSQRGFRFFLITGLMLRLSQWDKGSRTRHFQNKTRHRAQADTMTTKTLMKNPHKISMNCMSQDMWIWIWGSGTGHSEHNDWMNLEDFLPIREMSNKMHWV